MVIPKDVKATVVTAFWFFSSAFLLNGISSNTEVTAWIYCASFLVFAISWIYCIYILISTQNKDDVKKNLGAFSFALALSLYAWAMTYSCVAVISGDGFHFRVRLFIVVGEVLLIGHIWLNEFIIKPWASK